jgi:hypothetical protein
MPDGRGDGCGMPGDGWRMPDAGGWMAGAGCRGMDAGWPGDGCQMADASWRMGMTGRIHPDGPCTSVVRQGGGGVVVDGWMLGWGGG